MKKTVCLLLICLVSGIIYSQNSKKVSPVLDNPSIRKSEKEESRQTKTFDNKRRYSSVVHGHGSKALKKQQAQKNQTGKGL